MQYPSEKADSLERYVRKTFSLPRTARHLYSAMRWLEMNKKARCCGKVFAGYREIAEEAGIDIRSVKPALQALQTAGLVEVVIGCPIKSQKCATSIRRKTLDEIKSQSTQGDGDAHRLAAALSKMAFRFGEKVIKPCWTVGRTGRVCSSNPNIQGVAPSDRLAGLKKSGIKEGYALVHADIKQAEPSIIKHLLKIPQERDLYRQYMDATHCHRDQAKKAINSLAYCRNSMACFEHWPPLAQTALLDYVEALADYKKELLVECRKSRIVRTITGRVIAEKGGRLHAGRVMNWRVQGTVADIVNAACLRLLDSATVIVPLHDAVYAAIPNDKTPLVEAAITDKAREVGLTLKVETQVHHAG